VLVQSGAEWQSFRQGGLDGGSGLRLTADDGSHWQVVRTSGCGF
jgi:hypothetical protein